MLTLLIAAAAIASPIEDFAPLTPGLKLTYEDELGRQVMHEFSAPIDMGKGVMVTPKTTYVAGQDSVKELFKVDGDTLLLVGFLDTRVRKAGEGQPPIKPEPTPLNPPQPILRVTAAKSDWQYTGEVATQMGPVLFTVRGDAARGPKRKILNREVETLTAHVFSKIGNDKTHAVEIRQDVVYGKGIGMVEMNTVTKAEGKTVKNVLKLVKFEPPQN